MPKTYQDAMTMTERAIRDELKAIAALPPEEITLEDAHRAHHLKGCLMMIERAHLAPEQTTP